MKAMDTMEQNIKLIVAYDGGNYHGFQRQKNAVSIQNVLEAKLGIVFGHEVCLTASGRTDTGVHACGQVVNFFTRGTIPIDRVARALNSLLPDDIVVKSASLAAADFSARYSAKRKLYTYQVQQGEVQNPFLRNYSWYIRKSLDAEAMQLAISWIIGTHDFSAFRASGSTPMHPVRTIYAADFAAGDELLKFSFMGNGFLYHMVRNLVGTLVNVGKGKTSVEEFKEILNSRDRQKAGATAPAQGLHLMEVFYD